MRNCFNCNKAYTLTDCEGMNCPDSEKCNNGSLWEPIHKCSNCIFKKYMQDNQCFFKEDTSAKKIPLINGFMYGSSNRLPTKNRDESEFYCNDYNQHWAWKIDEKCKQENKLEKKLVESTGKLTNTLLKRGYSLNEISKIIQKMCKEALEGRSKDDL